LRFFRLPGLSWSLELLVLCTFVALSGCSRLRPKLENEYVYVTAKQTDLRDRVAAVSNRTGTVENGDKLEVLEHGRRFLRVKTPKGELGWIDEKVVAPQQVSDGFDRMKSEHAKDPAVASAVVRDEVYMHLKPGRDTEKLYRLTEGEKLKLLRRATLEKALPPGQKAAALVAVAVPKVVKGRAGTESKVVPEVLPGPPMEDWWLVRDSQGRTGWLLSRMMDVDAPESLTRYAEGQRTVGAYLLARVNDPEAPMDDKDVPEYVTVLSPYKAGLPYDFDQVRVFIWNAKKHRYETGFREKNIEGYLPVEVRREADPYAKGPAAGVLAPTFRYRLLTADAPPVVPDPVSGAVVPTRTMTKTYRLEGNLVRRVIAPGSTPTEPAHPQPVEEKKGRKRR
jgi:SH3-like domain-containing protein